jgi:hypothetical protein
VINEASRAWVAGTNPYDEPALKESWRAHPVPRLLEHIDHVESLLPPPTLAVTARLALVPRKAAMIAWVAIQWGSLIATIAALCAIAKLPQADPRAIVLAGLVLILGPVQSGVQAGQPVVPAVACIVGAILSTFATAPSLPACSSRSPRRSNSSSPRPSSSTSPSSGPWRTALTAASFRRAHHLHRPSRVFSSHKSPGSHDWLANVAPLDRSPAG